MTRCDDCYAQVEQEDWWHHRAWHQDQEALEPSDYSDTISNLALDVTTLETQMQDVFDTRDNDLYPRLKKIEELGHNLLAILNERLAADKQQDQT